MQKSESIANLAAALAKAHKALGVAKKNAVNKSAENHEYADISSLILACKTTLAEHGISIIQGISGETANTSLETMLLHETGEFIAYEMKVPIFAGTNPLWDLGSALTYCQRYQLRAALCIPSEDTDGQTPKAKIEGKKKEVAAEHDAKAGTTETLPSGGTVTYIASEPIPQHAENEEPETTAENPPAHSNAPWRDVVIHVGKKDGRLNGKTLGEIEAEDLDFLATKWAPKKPTAKDIALAAAVKEAIAEKHGTATETAPEPLPEKENAPQAAPESAAGTSGDWRNVVVHSVSGSVNARTLGEVVFAKLGELKTKNPMTGFQMLEMMASEKGVAMIQDGDANAADKLELLTAIRDALAATKVITDLRMEIAAKIIALGVKMEDADNTLVESGLEKVGEASEEMLRHIIAQWETIATALKGE